MGPLPTSIDNPSPDMPDQVEKQAAYPGEDLSYTSQRELNGWLLPPTERVS